MGGRRPYGPLSSPKVPQRDLTGTVRLVRSVICRTYGDPETLVVEDSPEPEPQAGEVAVRMGAAAVNFPDVLLVANKYQVSIPTPFVPGSEFAGEVSAVGDDVESLRGRRPRSSAP